MYWRWPSAKIVSNTRLLLPEPLGPVTTTNWLRGMSRSIDLRLWVRALVRKWSRRRWIPVSGSHP